VELGHYVVGSPIEHVAPGTYRLFVRSDHGTERERLAIVEVESVEDKQARFAVPARTGGGAQRVGAPVRTAFEM
jgi:hypothetical protein